MGVTFDNQSAVPFTGMAHISIYDTMGVLVTTLDPASLSASGYIAGEVLLTWDTIGMAGGPYVALAELTDETGTISYGVTQQRFTLYHAVFLPLVLRE